MPGLNLLIPKRQPRTTDVRRRFESSLKAMKHFDNYEISTLIDNENVMFGFSGYPGYPLKKFSIDDTDLFIEGNIYNLSWPEIHTHFESMVRNQPQLKQKAFDFISRAEGEFVVVMHDRMKHAVVIFNDALGRLPAYVNSSSDHFIFSREVKFILAHLKDISFDRDALAEYLLFRYLLQERTLIDGVFRLPPGSLVSCDLQTKVEKEWTLIPWGLDPEAQGDLDIRSAASQLLAVFRETVQNISTFSEGKTVMVSLSGGYDSRTVLSGFVDTPTKPVAFTFLNGPSSPDIPSAAEVARVLGVKHEIVAVPNPGEFSISEQRRFVYLYDGLNSVNHYPSWRFSQIVRERIQGDLIGFSGEDGDKTLAPIGYNFTIRNLKHLAAYILFRERCFTPKRVGILLKADPQLLQRRVEDILDSYPEETLEGKFKHFKIFERDFKWVFEGESRDRAIFWQTSPFFSLRFFVESMKLPEQMKKGRLFYRTFLTLLKPECADIPYPRPRFYPLLHRLSLELPIPLIQFLSERIPKDVLWARRGKDLNLYHLADEIIGRSKLVQEYFNVEGLRQTFMTEPSEERLLVLLSIILYMDLIEHHYEMGT